MLARTALPPLYSSPFPDYDLVRIYHPDSPAARAGGIPPETAHARFQAISSAYAVLSGKKPATSLDGTDSEGFGTATRSSYHDLSTAMWRAKQRRRAEMDIGMDDRWKERLMLGAILLVRLHLVSAIPRALSRPVSCVNFCKQTAVLNSTRCVGRCAVRLSELYDPYSGNGRSKTASSNEHSAKGHTVIYR